MKQHTSKKIGAAMLGIIAVAGIVAAGPRVEREGDPAHREALLEIETQPFASELFDGLDKWTHDEVVNAEAIEGKVVLVGFVSAGNSQSMVSLASLSRYHRKYADKGLVVLAVHPELGWDAFDEKVAGGRVKVPSARDAGGLFAQGLMADGYPDLYLVDRAGQLRYADFENRSLKGAVAQLLKETPEEAIANAVMQSEGIEIAEEATSVKEIPTAAYANADWPGQNSGKLTALNYQGKQLPVPLGNEDWLSEEREIDGKVIVLDFWATWCGPCKAASPMLEKMQIKHEGKLEILAIGGPSDDEAKHRKYVIQNKKAYSNLYDPKGTINNAMKVRAIPHTVIMSTDGVIRWQGNPLSSDFAKALDQVVKADPMFAED